MAISINATLATLSLAAYAATVGFATDVEASPASLSLTPSAASVRADTIARVPPGALTLTPLAATIKTGSKTWASLDTLTLAPLVSVVTSYSNIAVSAPSLRLTANRQTVDARTGSIRKQIRAEVAAALDGLPTTGANVYTSRVTPFANNELPGLNIETADESADDGDMHAIGETPEVVRQLELVIEGRVKKADGLLDQLDDIADEVEAVLYRNKFGGLIKDSQLASTTVAVNDELELPIGIITMTYAVLYITRG